MVAPRSPAPLGPAVLPAVSTSPVPVLFLPPPPCSTVIVAGSRSPLTGASSGVLTGPRNPAPQARAQAQASVVATHGTNQYGYSFLCY